MPARQPALVFISGPYSASSRQQIAKHIREAELIARKLVHEGFYFLCPHLNSAQMHNIPQPTEFWYRMYLRLLEQCDALLLIGAWQKSAGCTLEVASAERLQIPVFESIDELKLWHRGTK